MHKNIQDIKYYIPGGGFGKLTEFLQIESKKIRVSCAAPSHPAVTNVKSKSKSHAAITF